MKKKFKIQMLGALLISASVIANAQTSCEDLTGCKKKICSIEKNIEIAKEMENNAKVKGLEISLKKVTTHCTDGKLIEDLEDKIKDTKKDLQEDKEDYEEALKDNRVDKIEKYKAKMAKENEKIKRLEEELQTLH